ncbi:unnamed protein product [Nippostrongylus brasiliensis]|uniref:Uncharacterized protein n=1 Tax=Nippostrongylus brasiliensis TaxID=27835 RepID=A0A0N4YQT7_NIPBR|nr:unnamed protein product [Nippostrongylus brasiliensis]
MFLELNFKTFLELQNFREISHLIIKYFIFQSH